MEAKSKRRLIARALACGLALISLRAQAIRPEWKYRVLTSPHFEMIYRDEQKPLAKRYILAAEQAYELLFPVFKEAPARTIIFLQDDTDASNGEADFLPYPHITVYPVLPTTLDAIDDYGDWAFEMILHEYTHILNMYPAHGIYWPFKYIFGTVVRPNAVLPTWYLEGLAVDMESVFSDHGRLRSSETAAGARALVLDDLLHKENIGRINQQGMGTWPYGARPYLYGGWWWNNVQSEKGTAVIETWNQNFARRLPFLLNGPMIEQTGKGAGELLTATAGRLETEAKKEIDVINASKPSKGGLAGDADGEQTVFAISPSGLRMIYWVGTRDQGTICKVRVRTSPDQEFGSTTGLLLFSSSGTQQARWLDEDHVVFDAIPPHDLYTTYRDLYMYDFKENKTSRLTFGARAQEPAVGPEGDIAFIQNDGGRNHLAVRKANGEIKQLVNGNLFQRLSGPEYFGRDQILFIVRQRSGQESIYSYNLSTRKAEPWTDKLKNAQNLRKTSNGFLVTDASTGVRNVYWIHDGLVEPVSNTLTDIETADYDPIRKELVVSELTGTGARLHAFPFTTYKPPQVPLVQLAPPPKPTIESVPLHESSYQPVEYLLPHYWIPFVYQIDGGLLFQGITNGSDPAGRNTYDLSGAYDTVSKRGSYGFDYANHSTPVDMALLYNKFNYSLGASGLNLESQVAMAALGSHWPWNNNYHTFTLGGEWTETASTVAYRRLGPLAQFEYRAPRKATRKWLNLYTSVSHTEFLAQDGYLAYGRSYAHVDNDFLLGAGQKIRFSARSSLSPKLPLRQVLTLGDPNIGGNYAVNLTNSDFLLRGYPTGEFVGRKVINGNLEYMLKPYNIEAAMGTFPFFIQSLQTVFFYDTMAVDGAAYNTSDRLYHIRNLGQFESGAGAELRFESTVAYHLPLTFTFGGYYGFDTRYGGGFSPFIGISYGTLSGLKDGSSLKDKTP